MDFADSFQDTAPWGMESGSPSAIQIRSRHPHGHAIARLARKKPPIVERRGAPCGVGGDALGPKLRLSNVVLLEKLKQKPFQFFVGQPQIGHARPNRLGRVRQAANGLDIVFDLFFDRLRAVKQPQIRNQGHLAQGGPESGLIAPIVFASVTIDQRRKQEARKGHVVRERPLLRLCGAKDAARVRSQAIGHFFQQQLGQIGIQIGEGQVLERRHAEGILGAGAQRGRNKDQQTRPQPALLVGVAQFHQFGRGHETGPFLLARRREDKDVFAPTGRSSAQIGAHPHHEALVEIRNPHAVAGAAPIQNFPDAIDQQPRQRPIPQLRSQRRIRVAHAPLPPAAWPDERFRSWPTA